MGSGVEIRDPCIGPNSEIHNYFFEIFGYVVEGIETSNMDYTRTLFKYNCSSYGLDNCKFYVFSRLTFFKMNFMFQKRAQNVRGLITRLMI